MEATCFHDLHKEDLDEGIRRVGAERSRMVMQSVQCTSSVPARSADTVDRTSTGGVGVLILEVRWEVPYGEGS